MSIKIKVALTILALIGFCSKPFAQCTPTNAQHVFNSAFHEPANPTTNFSGYMCSSHDTLIADTTGGNGGWQFYYGDGYGIHLIAGSQISITTNNYASAIPIGLSINDSAQQIIAGAHVAAALNNSINFTASYTGLYYVVFDSNNVCQVDGQTAVGSVMVVLSNSTAIQCPAAPINDTICGAIALVLNTPITGSNINANPTDPRDADAATAGFACSTPNNTLWYLFTPSTNGNYLIQTSSPATIGLDAWVGLFDAASCVSTFSLTGACLQGCTNGAGLNNNFVTMNAGTTYYIMIDGQTGSIGTFTIQILNAPATPINDTICGAKTLVLNTPITDDNTAASPTDPRDVDVQTAGFSCSTPSNTLWYKFTPTTTGTFYIKTNSPSTNGLQAWVGVFDATSCKSTFNSGVCLPGCSPGNGTIVDTVSLTAGLNYYIMIDGFLGAVGSYTIEISQEAVTSGIKDLASKTNIFIAPNPATDNLNIQFTDKLNGDILIQLFDITGRMMIEKNINNKHETQIDISNLNEGTYIIKISNAGNVLYRNKIIKQ